MFTGIIEQQGTIRSLESKATGGRLTIHAPKLVPALAVSNSIAVNGCCLTIVTLSKESFSADLSGETLEKTSFGAKISGLAKGTQVNLEQPLTAGKEFGGHFVLGMWIRSAVSHISLRKVGTARVGGLVSKFLRTLLVI